MADIESERFGSYPKPSEPGWEDKYRAAFAKDEVYSNFLTRIQSWAQEAESIVENEKSVTRTIV